MTAPANRVKVYLSPLPGDFAEEPSMRFRLAYDGELRPTGRDPEAQQRDPLAVHKQRIRKVFHGQLKQLWQTNKFLRGQRVSFEELHATPMNLQNSLGIVMGRPPERMPLSAAIATNTPRLYSYRFVPLVCEVFWLQCNLDILFLRRDHPPSVLNAGDLDNRVKTLIDTLRMPKSANELAGHETPADGEDPFFCLLEDDNLVTGLMVEADTLLDPPLDGDGGSARARVVISVELKPNDVTMFNLGFA